MSYVAEYQHLYEIDLTDWQHENMYEYVLLWDLCVRERERERERDTHTHTHARTHTHTDKDREKDSEILHLSLKPGLNLPP